MKETIMVYKIEKEK